MQVFDSIFVRAQNAWFAFRDEESGQTLVEYALIISLVALACILALGFLSGRFRLCSPDAGNSLRRAVTRRGHRRQWTTSSSPVARVQNAWFSLRDEDRVRRSSSTR